jgi:hypothetical protein
VTGSRKWIWRQANDWRIGCIIVRRGNHADKRNGGTMSDEEAEQIKETYACFGLAAYMDNVLGTGLAHTLLQIDFLTNVRKPQVGRAGAAARP